jgi:hypothetical protein
MDKEFLNDIKTRRTGVGSETVYWVHLPQDGVYYLASANPAISISVPLECVPLSVQ